MKIRLYMVLSVFLLSAVPMAHASEIQLPRSGQTLCYDSAGVAAACAGTGQDGDKLAGVAWPSARFTDNGNGTVLDNLTGLIWLKNAECFGLKSWQQALDSAKALVGNNSACGLNDASVAGDWRLPNAGELESLVDISQQSPALTGGHPFTAIQVADIHYWSSTTFAGAADSAWNLRMSDGFKSFYGKGFPGYVWPVRGGQ